MVWIRVLIIVSSLGVVLADEAGFKGSVLPFFETYCLGCHDSETSKGNLSLEALGTNLNESATLEIWRMVFDQLHFKEMPPPKRKQQPSADERQAVMHWVRDQLRRTQEPGKPRLGFLAEPKFGNYVDHAA